MECECSKFCPLTCDWDREGGQVARPSHQCPEARPSGGCRAARALWQVPDLEATGRATASGVHSAFLSQRIQHGFFPERSSCQPSPCFTHRVRGEAFVVPGSSVQLRTRRPCQNTWDLPLAAPAVGGTSPPWPLFAQPSLASNAQVWPLLRVISSGGLLCHVKLTLNTGGCLPPLTLHQLTLGGSRTPEDGEGKILPSPPLLALPIGKGHCFLTQARRAVEGERQVERQAPTWEDEGQEVPALPTPAGVLTPDSQPVSAPSAQATDVAALGCSLVVTREHRTMKF